MSIFSNIISLEALTPAQFVFMPHPTEPDDQFGYMEHHVTIRTPDGIELNGWFFNRGPNKPLVVFYHGKGAHVGWDIDKMAHDTERSYLFINYRGYGWSQGLPTEKDVVNDARFCIAWSREQIGGYSALIVCGCSLGTGIAVQVAAHEKADKLILIAPYDSMYNAAVQHMRNLTGLPDLILKPFCWTCIGDTLNSTKYAPDVTCPVDIFFARHDDIIPHESTWNLYHSFTSTHPVDIWIDCTHVNFFQTEKFVELYTKSIAEITIPQGGKDTPWMLVERGDDFYHGRNGYAENPTMAMEYYRKAAEYNYHWGQFNVGKCYREGKGVQKNEDEARKWFLKAAHKQNFWALYQLADMGDARYMSDVGDCYYDGRYEAQGCPYSPEDALLWYKKSAELNFHWGCFNVGKCYAEGKGVPQDSSEAKKWFSKAEELANNPWATRCLAELGDTDAARRVCEYYATGSMTSWGMHQNAEEAEYFRKRSM